MEKKTNSYILLRVHRETFMATEPNIALMDRLQLSTFPDTEESFPALGKVLGYKMIAVLFGGLWLL